MSNRKLLLADDSITIQKVVNLTFADEGIDVITVSDGNSAMDKLRENIPDLVMADVNMPGLNGYEICEKIKQIGNNKTPVILLVGSFEPFDEEEANRVGADGYLTKPFQSISQLVEKVTELLKISDEASFADTIEILPENGESNKENGKTAEATFSPTNIVGDSKRPILKEDFLDDEMIQTSQVGSVPIVDSNKLETPKEISENGSENHSFENGHSGSGNDKVPFDADYAELEIDDKANTAENEKQESYNEESFADDLNLVSGQNSSFDDAIEDYQNTEKAVVESEKEEGKSSVTDEIEDVSGSSQSKLGESLSQLNDQVVSEEKSLDSQTNEIGNQMDDQNTDTLAKDASAMPNRELAALLKLDENNLLDLPPLAGVDETKIESTLALEENETLELRNTESEELELNEIKNFEPNEIKKLDLETTEEAKLEIEAEPEAAETEQAEVELEETSIANDEETQDEFESEDIGTEDSVDFETKKIGQDEDALSDENTEVLEIAEENEIDSKSEEKIDIAEENQAVAGFSSSRELLAESISNSEFSEIAEEMGSDVSPDTVKIIAEKIVERISKKEVREIAWEVVPELAELIVNKMAKEKIKD